MAGRGWGPRFASNGYVAVFVEANNTGSDSAQMRADGAWEAIATMKAENTKSGGQLMGKLSDCYITSGHSLGGGASLLTANAHPTDIKGALGFNPYEGSTSFSKIVVPTLILTGDADTTAPPAQHGRRQYDSILATTTKEYCQEAGGVHQSALWTSGTDNSGNPGRYAIAWIKYNIDGDTRYRPFLDKVASGLSDFATTLP
jgi:predicted dienelactone hydrolase